MELALSSVRFGFVFIFIFVEALIDREIGNNFVDSPNCNAFYLFVERGCSGVKMQNVHI